MRKTLALAALAAVTLGRPLAARADDWPQWRGKSRDGISAETGLLKQWPAGGPALVWTATGIGEGYSGPAVVGAKVYTMGDVAGSSCLLALNAANGKIHWTAKMGQPGGGGGYAGTRCTPTVDGGMVYGINQHGDVVCVKAATGAEAWRRQMSEFGGKMMSDWGYSESPLVDGDKLVCTPGGPGGTVAALNKTTGATVWQSKGLTDSAAYSSLITVTIGGVKQYIVLTDRSLAGIAPADGSVLWRADRPGRVAVIPTPVYKDGMFFVTSGYGVGCNMIKVTNSGGAFSAQQVYANTAMADHHGGVVLIGDNVYGHSDSSGWVCMELATGKVVWSERANAPGKGSIAAADGMLIVRQEGGPGTIGLLKATPAGYQEVSRFDQPSRSSKNSWPHPVIANGKLYIRDQDVMLCYDIKGK
ncbi:MAG: PQQ-binding-like beta-propeller repeat protein [Armatimonadetes bacterium]|nr:PQQ-binding-like beta-propeller repeat protein [Armatimonadota bacterium]